MGQEALRLLAGVNSDPLVTEAVGASRAKKHAFYPAPGTDFRGILSLECFT